MKHAQKILFICLFFFFIWTSAKSQIIAVNVVQNMNFGAFYQGSSGGTITISNAGARSFTGGVVGMNLGVPYFQAAFDVTTLLFTNVSISNGPDATLTGSNGGTMTLKIGNSDPASPFVGSIGLLRTTRVNIGGTLTIGNPTVCPAGSYTGTFYVTFNNQ